MKARTLFLAAAVTLLAARVPAATPAATLAGPSPTTPTAVARPTAAQELNLLQNALADLSGEFTLMIRGAGAGGGDLNAAGRVWMAAGRRYRVEYDRPEIQTLVSNGKQRWLYLKKINQVQIQPLPPAGNPGELFLELGGGLPALVARCRVRRLADDQGRKVFLLTPKPDAGLAFRQARIWLAGPLGLPARVEVDAARRVRAEFSRLTAHTRAEVRTRPSAAVPADRFEFVPPAGAEVIEPLF